MRRVLEEINRKLDILIDYMRREEEARWRLFEVLLGFAEEEEPEPNEREAIEEALKEKGETTP